MPKNSVSFLKKSKALLGSNCLVLSLVLLASSTQVLGSGRPRGMYGQETYTRLEKKLKAKQLAAADECSARLNEDKNDLPHTEFPKSIIRNLAGRVISEDEKSQIQQGFLAVYLDPTEIKTIQETFLTSLDSALEYVQTTSNRLNSEINYFCNRNPDFNIREAFGTDLFQSMSIYRRDFIINVHPLVEGGLEPMKGFRERFSNINTEDLAHIVPMYYSLVSHAYVSWKGLDSFLNLLSTACKNPLINKKARLLLSSVYDEGILQALETAQKLLPYAQIIESILNIPELQEIIDHAKIIYQNVLKRLPKLKQGNVISPEALKQTSPKKGLRKDTRQSLGTSVSKSTLEETSRILSSSAIPSSLPTPTPLEIAHPIPFVEEESSQASSSLEIPSSSPALDLVDIQPEMSKIPSSMSLPLSSATSSSLDTFEHPLEQKGKRKDLPTKIKPNLDGEDREEEKFSLGGGPFKTFSKLLSKTYKGSIEKVVILFESLGGKVNEGRSGSRIKFELPHFLTQNTVMLDVFSPQDGGEPISQPSASASPRKKSKSHRSKAARSKPYSSLTDLRKRQEVVLHSPHKRGSKKLAPYHVNDIRDILLRAGFTEERVTRRES